MCEGWRNCLKYLQRGWNRKEGRENKDFKKGGQAGSKGGCLKKGGLEPSYELCDLAKKVNQNSPDFFQIPYCFNLGNGIYMLKKISHFERFSVTKQLS